jgi:hypothetical protein
MKLKSLLMMSGMGIALCLGANQGLAQNNGGGGGQGGRPDFQNMSPEEMRQFFLDRVRERLEVKDDAEWNALKPLVQKVMDARRDTMSDGGGFGGMGGRRRGGDNGGDNGGGRRRGGFMPEPSAEREALQKAIDAQAPKAEIKAALAKFKDARKTRQEALEKAQNDLRKVLTSRQEAIAAVEGYL